jgi:dTDP-4-amino-4,6-dideoxygalactose transaminase
MATILSPMARTISKRRLGDLAILGGRPAFDKPLYVGRPNLGDRERFLSRVDRIFERRWFSNDGPVAQELEERLATFLGVKHCIAVANATLGLQLVAQATGLSGEVIVPSFTFIATAHALKWQGIDPVFCDVDPSTHNIDPQRVEELITSRTSAILGVHLWGRPCDVSSLEAVARKHSLHLLFDAAHALGCSHKGQCVGGFGSAEVFSFHATKFFNSFEGGAITTNDDGLADGLRAMRNFGYDSSGEIVALGMNAKMHEVSAAMGLSSLDEIDTFIDANRRNRRDYAECLEGVPGIHLIEFDRTERHNYQYMVLEVDDAVTGITRDDLQRVLIAENVAARRYFSPPCHLQHPYKATSPAMRDRLGVTERLAGQVLQLPTGTAVGPGEIQAISDLVRVIVSQGREMTARLPTPSPSERRIR